MAQTIRLTYYGMDGEGATLKEAKADAARKVEAALEGDYAPYLLRLGKTAFLVFRTPLSGWGYAPSIQGRGEGPLHHNASGYASRAEAIRDARHHMAQNLIHILPDEELIAFVHADQRRQLADYIQWQHRARAWMQTYPEMSSSDVHAHSCRGEWPEAAAS